MPLIACFQPIISRHADIAATGYAEPLRFDIFDDIFITPLATPLIRHYADFLRHYASASFAAAIELEAITEDISLLPPDTPPPLRHFRYFITPYAATR
jgi:hypothetical protein